MVGNGEVEATFGEKLAKGTLAGQPALDLRTMLNRSLLLDFTLFAIKP